MTEWSPELSLKDRVGIMIHGMTAERSTHGLEDLFLRLSYRAYPGENPPPFVNHVTQVALVTDEILINTGLIEREWGKRYAIGHDIGRSVEMGTKHPKAGARILRDFGYQSSLITFALAHHRWGLGIPIFIKDTFPNIIEQAILDEEVERIVDKLINERGVAALAVLIADNSKKPIAPNSFETEIAPFNMDLAYKLLNVQIIRGRYVLDSTEYRVEELGAKFVHAIIPHLEDRLGITYAPNGTGHDVISRARAKWPAQHAALLAKWQKIHYDQTREY